MDGAVLTGRPRKDLRELESREGRGGKRLYFYNGNWHSAEAIETLRVSARRRYTPVGPPVRLSDEDRAARVEALVAGLDADKSAEQVAEELGITGAALSETVKNGTEAQRRRVKRARERRRRRAAEKLAAMMVDGLTVKEIAAQLGINRDAADSLITRKREAFGELIPTPERYAYFRRRARARALGELMKVHGTYGQIAAATGRKTTTVGEDYRRLLPEFPELMPKPRMGRPDPK